MSSWEDFKDLKTKDLIISFHKIKDGANEHKNILNAILVRFLPKVKYKCQYISKSYNLDDTIGDEIAEKSFIKYAKSKTFNVEKYSIDEVDKKFLAYLFQIANNTFKDYIQLNAKIESGKAYTGKEKIITEMPDIDTSNMNHEESLIYDTLLSFSEKHKIIYLNYETYKIKTEEGEKKIRLPKHLLKPLREHLGLSQNSIRQYYYQVSNKINEVDNMIKTLKLNE